VLKCGRTAKMLFGWQVNKLNAGYTERAQKAGLLFLTCLLDFRFTNEKGRRLTILNVSSHCFTRSFVGSRNKVEIKTVHYHAKKKIYIFPLMVCNCSTSTGLTMWTDGQRPLQQFSTESHHCIFYNNNNNNNSFGTKGSYIRNITQNTESTVVRNMNRKRWGSSLVQEKYQEKMPVTEDIHIV